MYSRVWRSFPKARTMAVVFLIYGMIGIFLKGFHPAAFWCLFFVIPTTAYLWIGNYNPFFFNPTANRYAQAEMELYGALEELTNAVEDANAHDLLKARTHAHNMLSKHSPWRKQS